MGAGAGRRHKSLDVGVGGMEKDEGRGIEGEEEGEEGNRP